MEKVPSDVSFSLKILRPARKKLDKMDNNLVGKIYAHIENLREDTYRPRPGMDIVKIEGNLRPPGLRLRIGRWRIEYVVLDEKLEVRIGRIFPRSGDSDHNKYSQEQHIGAKWQPEKNSFRSGPLSQRKKIRSVLTTFGNISRLMRASLKIWTSMPGSVASKPDIRNKHWYLAQDRASCIIIVG